MLQAEVGSGRSLGAGPGDDLGPVDRAAGPAQVAAEVGGREGDRQVEGGLVALGEEGDGGARAGDDAAEGTELEAGVAQVTQLGAQREGRRLEVVVQGPAERGRVPLPQRGHQLVADLGVGDGGGAVLLAEPVALGIDGRASTGRCR